MSLVGTRPPTVDEYEQYEIGHRKRLESLREQIINGTLQPQEKLVEAEIAQKFGLSRGPVREALRQLAFEGLVDYCPNKGCILALVTMSMGFVLTTRPRDLVLSLILQCRVSVIHGYATMAAYRFLPELQAQVDSIHLAQEIRGIPWNKGLISRFTSPFRVMLPLLCVAARRGERVACAMESRGLGRTEKRTYYKTTEVTKSDWLFLVIGVIIYIIIVMILVKYDLFKLNFASIK